MENCMTLYHGSNQEFDFDLIMKIEKIVRLIAAKEHRSFDDCYIDFVASKTYESLQNTETLMWSESAEFIVDEYYGES